MAETGLPGSPNTGKVPLSGDGTVAKVMGLPGRMSTSQRCCSAPSAAQRGLDVIVLAHGDTCRRDEEIGAQPPGEPRLDLVLPIAGHAED